MSSSSNDDDDYDEAVLFFFHEDNWLHPPSATGDRSEHPVATALACAVALHKKTRT